MSQVRGLSIEKLGVWKDNFRPVLVEMLAQWPEEIAIEEEEEMVDFVLPDEVQVVTFSCQEYWQIPSLLDLTLAELKSETVLAGWLRRLGRRWGARPFSLADDVIWFLTENLPTEDRRELFLADLINMSSDVAECFEPTLIREVEEGFVFPVPLQLTFSSDLSETPQQG